MTREMRFRFIGTVFYLFLVLNLLFTRQVWTKIVGEDKSRSPCSAQDRGDEALEESKSSGSTGGGGDESKNTRNNKAITLPLLIAALGLGATLLTSDAIGYLFGSVVLVWWERRWLFWGKRRGWSDFWACVALKDKVLKKYRSLSAPDGRESTPSIELQDYLKDVFFSYFWERAPKELYDWPKRRHFAFLTNTSLIAAIILAYIIFAVVALVLLGILIFGSGSMPLMLWHLIPLVFAVFFIAVLVRNSKDNLEEMRQFVKLCFRRSDDKNLFDALAIVESEIPWINEEQTHSEKAHLKNGHSD